MTTTMFSTTVCPQELNESRAYEVIENELLKSCDLKDLTVSGSLFSLTTFIDVTFRSCVFFGSRFENCRFINCKFENCSFQFSTLTHCDFSATEFHHTHWESPSIRKCSFDFSYLDIKTEYFIMKNSNYLESCYLERESALHAGEETVTLQQFDLEDQLPPLPQQSNDETPLEDLWTSFFGRVA